MAILTDDSPMPYGKFKDTKMANVPDNYLLWLYRNTREDHFNKPVFRYIEENLNAIEANVHRTREKDAE